MMVDLQVEFFKDMINFPGYPTPPLTSEDSPVSYTTLSPAAYTSESSSSPGASHTPQMIILSPTLNLTPTQVLDQSNNGSVQSSQPYLEITEQPMDKFRFRYRSEMTGTHGCLNGERSDKTRKMTYPSVKLHHYKGSVIIRCSIWQMSHNGNDFMPHAHRLVKKRHGQEEADDPHELTVNESTGYEASFFSMGIIHTAKKNLVPELIKKKTALMKEFVSRQNRQNLTKKEEMEIKGLAEAESKSINLNVVCLRFDAFYVIDDIRYPICPPVFSHAINNLKSALTGELKIVRMDHCTSPAKGGREVFLLVERVTKKNIKVRFFELNERDDTIWEEYGKFNDLDVHHQYAIVLRTPQYRDGNISRPVNVFMELVRPSDGAKSEPKEFTYTPSSNYCKPGSKRARPNDFDSSEYDTSGSVESAVIPRPVQNLSDNLNDMNIDEIDSSELDKLLMNINSKEFKQMFEENKSAYESALLSNSDSFSNLISVDCGANRTSKRNSLLSTSNEQNSTYKKKVVRCRQEITAYLRTKPTNKEEIMRDIRQYMLNIPGDYNAFHMAAMIGEIRAIEFFINIMVQYQQLDIVNIPAKSGGSTALHIAVVCGDVELAKVLVTTCQADVSVTDSNLNTSVHLASEDRTGNMTECLMKGVNADKCIDYKNKNGNTPLLRAVKRGNFKAVEVLCRDGADVNYEHPKNGFTPLRFAVENRDVEMIRFFLYETKADPTQKDFNGVDCIQVINQKDYPEVAVSLIKKYMSEHSLSSTSEIDIKDEPEDEDSENEMEIFEEEVKAEPLPLVDDEQNILQSMDHFTEDCLTEISELIDSSGKWEDLARLLDIEYLLRMETVAEKSPGKRILSIATQVATIKEIRGFLEDLDETKAVEAIDRMALNARLSSSQCPPIKNSSPSAK